MLADAAFRVRASGHIGAWWSLALCGSAPQQSTNGGVLRSATAPYRSADQTV